MKRLISKPRPGWEKIVEDSGLMHWQGKWNEAAQYQFTPLEIEELKLATKELHLLSIQAVQSVITGKLYGELGIPNAWVPMIERSWERRDSSILGRLDLAFDGKQPPKLIEYNADNLGLLIETAWHQKEWLLGAHPDEPFEQFTDLHELLPKEWESGYTQRHIHFSCDVSHKEALANTIYMREMANAGGCTTTDINVSDIGWAGSKFVDMDNKPIAILAKNYAWDWLLKERFGQHLFSDPTAVVEPAWRILLNSKGILAILWRLFPNHPNLLPAAGNYIPVGREFVKKPLFGREGLNVVIQYADRVERTGGILETDQFVYQGIAPIPCFDGHYPIVSSFLVGDEPAGIGVKEDGDMITSQTAAFVPHTIYADAQTR